MGYGRFPNSPSINEVVDNLRGMARWDNMSNEFSHEAHICWIAADLIEDLSSEEISDAADLLEE